MYPTKAMTWKPARVVGDRQRADGQEAADAMVAAGSSSCRHRSRDRTGQAFRIGDACVGSLTDEEFSAPLFQAPAWHTAPDFSSKPRIRKQKDALS
jgi:hypothetical protein